MRPPNWLVSRRLGFLCLALTAWGCGGGGEGVVAPTSSTAPSTSSSSSTSSTVAPRDIRAWASEYCVDIAVRVVDETPGLVAELNDETIALLVDSAINTFSQEDFDSVSDEDAALEGCRTGLTAYYSGLLGTATTLAPPTEAVVVLTRNGSSDTETDDFTTTGTWEVAWSVTDGAGISVSIRRPSGERIDSISIDPGEDSSRLRQGCTCYLDISTFGSTYSITVTDVPD